MLRGSEGSQNHASCHKGRQGLAGNACLHAHNGAELALHTCARVQDDALLAYQICFDLFENESQSFMAKVRCACAASLARRALQTSSSSKSVQAYMHKRT